MKHTGERFYITLRIYWQEFPASEKTLRAMEFRDQVLYCFDVYGKFLDPIPIQERRPYIGWIIRWADWAASTNHHIKYYNDSMPNKKPSVAIKQDLKKIRKVIELLEDLDERQYLTADYTQEQTALRYLKGLEEDLDKKRFLMIHRSRYYKVGLTAKKQELREIISTMIETFNLKVSRENREALVDKIPLMVPEVD